MTPDFFAQMSCATSKDGIAEALRAMSESLGFPLYTMMYAGFGGCGAPESVVVSNTPRAFADASRDIEASRRDPVLRRLRSRTTPFIYTQATYVTAGAGDLWEEQAVHGYRNGVAMGLRLGRGRRFMIGFDSPDRVPSEEPTRSMLLAHLAAAAVTAARTCERVIGDEVAEALARLSPISLTPRETEVLPMLARGLSCPEIGQALRLSPRTVEKYIQGTMAKLGASRQTEVIAAAMRMDLIDDSFAINR